MDNLKICKSLGLFWQIADTCSDTCCRRCDLWECSTNRGHRCSRTWVLKGSGSASIDKHIGKWSASCWDPREWASMLIPELQEFHRLFAQMDILKQKLSKFGSRDTLICDNVLGSGSPTPPGVEFWRTKSRFYPAGHRKRWGAHNNTICRPITLRGKIKGLKKKEDSRWTVGHNWSWPKSITTTLIIIKIIIYSTNLPWWVNPAPAPGKHTGQGDLPF